MNYSVTVVVATHADRGLWLRDMINSLYHFNSDVGFKLIVVDNASIDDTRHYLTLLSRAKPSVSAIFNPENIDDTRAMNQVLPLIDTEYFLKVDSDTLFVDFLQISRAVTALQRNDAVLIGPFWDLSLRRRKESALWGQAYSAFNTLLADAQAAAQAVHPSFDVTLRLPRGNFLLARTDVLRRIGGFDERYLHNAMEFPLVARVLQQGLKYCEFVGDGVLHKPSEEVRIATRALTNDLLSRELLSRSIL